MANIDNSDSFSLRDRDWPKLREILYRLFSRGGSSVFLAKIQAAGIGTTTITCKRLANHAGTLTEVGAELTVYPGKHFGTPNDLNGGSVWPALTDGDNIPIFEGADGLYYTTFVFDDTTACS